MGEIEYSSVAIGSENSQATQKLLADAVRRFSRSIELCDDYLRGYYGLQKVRDNINSAQTRSDSLPQTTHRLLESLKLSAPASSSDIPPPNVIKQLHDLASNKLRHIIKSRNTQSLPSGSSHAELIAAQELLDRSQ
jgi:ER membrane protein complex subunit 2